MAYGRDAQAEEILKEALGKDPNRVAVHAKLLEIYANRKDAKSFEQTALKLKGLTGSAGPGVGQGDGARARHRSGQWPVWQRRRGGRSGAGRAPAAAAPALDFDIGGGSAAAAATKAEAGGLDFDIGATDRGYSEERFRGGRHAEAGQRRSARPASGGLDFDLGGARPVREDDGEKTMLMPRKAMPAPAPAPKADPDATVAMDFDLNLDLGGARSRRSRPSRPKRRSILAA